MSLGYKDFKKENSFQHYNRVLSTQEEPRITDSNSESEESAPYRYIEFSINQFINLINEPTPQSNELILTTKLISTQLKNAPKKKMFAFFTQNFFQELIHLCLDPSKIEAGRALCYLLKKICLVFRHYPFSKGSLQKILEFVTDIDPGTTLSIKLLMLIAKNYPSRCIQYEHIFYQNLSIQTVEEVSLFISYEIKTAMKLSNFVFSPMINVMCQIIDGEMLKLNVRAKTTVYTMIKLALKKKIPPFVECFRNEYWLKHFCEMRKSKLNSITILGWELTGSMIEFINAQILTSKEYLDFTTMNKFLRNNDGINLAKVQFAIFRFLFNAIQKSPSIIDIIMESESDLESCVFTPLLNCVHFRSYNVQTEALSVLIMIVIRASALQLRTMGVVNVIEAFLNHILTVDDTVKLTVIRCLIRIVNACNASNLDYKILEIFNCFDAQECLQYLLDSEFVANDAQILFDLVYNVEK